MSSGTRCYLFQEHISSGVDRVVDWLQLDGSYLALIVPLLLIGTVVVVVVVVRVACRRRPCTSKSSSPPQSQRAGCSAPTTSSVTTTSYLPGAASSGLDEYTRCFVASRRLNSGAVDWTSAGGGSPSVVATHGVVGMVVPAASSSPRQPLVSMSPALQSDVKYRFYDEC